MGESIPHPGGYGVKLAEPLDFSVVMDHSEYTGGLVMADDRTGPRTATNTATRTTKSRSE